MKQLKAQVYTDSDFPKHLFVRFHNGRIACARLLTRSLHKDGALWAFPSKPERDILSYAWITIGDIYSCRIPDDLFPDLKWDDEPLELMPKGKED